MAYETTMYCRQCKQTKSVMVGSGKTVPDICGECGQMRLEEWAYDHERTPPRYVPPPRY